MIIPNTDTVKNGVDLVEVVIPDDYSDIYYLFRQKLKQFYSDLFPDSTNLYKDYYTDLAVREFVQEVFERILNEIPSKVIRHKKNEELQRMYVDIVEQMKSCSAREALDRFREAVSDSIGRNTLNSPRFVYEVMSQMTKFEIIESEEGDTES